MTDTLWQALADWYIKGITGAYDNHGKLIDWKAEAAPIAAAHRKQVIRELVEKAEAQSTPPDFVDGAATAAEWLTLQLKPQMEGA